jgi:hypothetical protein
MAAPAVDTSNYSALGLSAAAAAAANPSLLANLAPASAAALQLRLATAAAGNVQSGALTDGNTPTGDKSDVRRQRRCAGTLLPALLLFSLEGGPCRMHACMHIE